MLLFKKVRPSRKDLLLTTTLVVSSPTFKSLVECFFTNTCAEKKYPRSNDQIKKLFLD